MTLTEFENNIGLQDCKGKIFAKFVLNSGAGYVYKDFCTTRRAFHKAVLSKKRYSLDKVLENLDMDGLIYKCKTTYQKDKTPFEKGACQVGVFNI